MDENGNVRDRLTCFRRGTTVWYLSRAVGAPCPFARAGIALRDYAEASAISSIEGRKPEDPVKGIKRKRERTSSRRAMGQTLDEEDELEEGRKPPKIKLTLRLRPCLTTMREKPEEIGSSSESEPESTTRPAGMADSPPSAIEPASFAAPDKSHESAWAFPPFPIQRHISIPPYTPVQESFPSACSSGAEPGQVFSEWPGFKPKLELACVDPAGSSFHSCQRNRSDSMAFSVASPPPDSEDEFSMDEDDDDISYSMSPEIRFKEEDGFAYEWPQAAPSTSSADIARVKVEPEEDVIPSKRSSVQTLTNVKSEDVELNFDSLSLSADDDIVVSSAFGPHVDVKTEEVDGIEQDNFSWSNPIDLTLDDDLVVRSSWKDVEIVGPESVDRKDLEGSSWDASNARSVSPQPRYASTSSPPSLDESARTWSVCSPDTDIESVGPLSPPSFDDTEPEPVVQVTDPASLVPPSIPSIQRSGPWSIPGKDAVSTLPSRFGAGRPASPAYLANESNLPWERGRYIAEDVDDHLLHTTSATSLALPIPRVVESEPIPAPLSPQEEELFQSLCFDPTASPPKPTNTQTAVPPSFANVFAVATRPSMRLRERRSSRLLSEHERVRPQPVQPQQTEQMNECEKNAEEDEHEEEDSQMPERAATRAKASKGPLRRSKRVASTTAPQRKSQRLRGKSTH